MFTNERSSSQMDEREIKYNHFSFLLRLTHFIIIQTITHTSILNYTHTLVNNMKYSRQVVLQQPTINPTYMSNSNMVAPQGINTSSTSNNSKAFTPVLKGLKNNYDISNTNVNANATSIDRTYTDRYDLLSDWLNEEEDEEMLEDIKEREIAVLWYLGRPGSRLMLRKHIKNT